MTCSGTGVLNQIQTAIGTVRIACKNGDLANVLNSETLPKVQEMVEKLEQVAGECAECGGTGMVGGHSGQTAESYEEFGGACPSCDDLRALLSRVRA